MNLLRETIVAVARSGHTLNDIAFIGSRDSGHSCDWEEFSVLAGVGYDNSFGGQNVAMDLIIAFNDGQTMWRGEYDGSEWWEFSEPFVAPTARKPISTLFPGSWARLGDAP